jgi:putative oxidoreductase
MKTIKDAIIIVVVAMALGLLVNFIRITAFKSGLAWDTKWADNRKISGEIEIPPSYQPGDSLLSLNDAYNLYAKGNAIFLDSREPEDYRGGHIRGAINFPFEQWDSYWDKIKPMLDPQKEIVAYCGGLDCELSLFLARQLKESGYDKAYIFFGGWIKWKEAGLPEETSAPPSTSSDLMGTLMPLFLGAYILIILIMALAKKGSISWQSILFISRLILGGLFIYASYDKIFNPLPFAQIIHNYRLVGPSLITFPAVVIPWIEFLAGALLIFGYRARGANLIIGGMLVMYIAMLSITASRGINIACGCFSTSPEVQSNIIMRIVEDVGMLLVSLHILIFYRAKWRSRGFTD